ncbi:MAG TPA: squalene/phytoene synthase family protein [Hyphomonadaceae bacterium]|nr:squalene/phytoene synthase family protein [Hyphomonadaceae bacterium]
MSDTSNPGTLASAAEFDARLKRTDENRWLATRYAPPEARELLVAIYLLHQELIRALHTKEAMLGKIRIQWWRETIGQIAEKSTVRRHDLAEELARAIGDRPDLIVPINDLIDRFDDVIDDHMRSGGHEQGGAHETRHLAAEASLTRLAGQALKATVSMNELDALTRCGEAHLAVVAEMEDAADRWVTACVAARELAPGMWPAILHLSSSAPADRPRSALSKRWRMFQAALTHRL